MREYAKLSPFFWVRGSGKRLRGDAVAQVVAAYLSTAPGANMIGIFYLSIATIADDTGHDVAAVREAMKRIEAAGYAYYDFDAGLVWIPNHARFDIGPKLSPGDRRRPKILLEIEQVVGHPFVDRFMAIYEVAYGLDGRGIRDSQERGIPSSLPPTIGAGAFREPIQSNPIQSIPGASETGDTKAGEPRDRILQLGTASAERALEVFADAISSVTGEPFVPETGVKTRDAICRAVNGHSRAPDTPKALEWLRITASDWASTWRDDARFTAGFSPTKFVDWLNARRPKPSGKRPHEPDSTSRPSRRVLKDSDL